MDRKEGLVTVEDVIRKVQRLDAKGQIWSQFVLLQVADRDIKIMDAASRGEIESFPMNDISLVSAELNQCNYNSILVIQFKFVGEKNPQTYVFQCDQVPVSEKYIQTLTTPNPSKTNRHTSSLTTPSPS